MVTRRHRRPDTPRSSEPPGGDALALFTAFATTNLLYLYPAGDFWHVIMGLPAFLPLLAYLLECFYRLGHSLDNDGLGRLASGVLAAGLSCCWRRRQRSR